VPTFRPLVARVARLGMLNALAQVALKIGSPGVPDFYQGTELWELNLVEPDNRGNVDFDLRAAMLTEIEHVLELPAADRASAVAGLVHDWPDGRVKLLVTTAGLRLRREWPDVFLSGRYVALDTDITVHGDVVAFARLHEDRSVIVAAPRLSARLVSDDQPLPLGGTAWKTSRIMLPPELAGRRFRDAITGAEIVPTSAGEESWIFAGQAFETIPVAILRT
jgi:(1->4)-alpha-D-glucan 1-alpha-D-glucosylmutase